MNLCYTVDLQLKYAEALRLLKYSEELASAPLPKR